MSPVGVAGVVNGKTDDLNPSTATGAAANHLVKPITPAKKPRGRRISRSGGNNPDIYLTTATGHDQAPVSSRLRSASRGEVASRTSSPWPPQDLSSPSIESVSSPSPEEVFSSPPTASTPGSNYDDYHHDWVPQEDCQPSPSRGSANGMRILMKGLDMSSDSNSKSDKPDEAAYESSHDSDTEYGAEITQPDFPNSNKKDNDIAGHHMSREEIKEHRSESKSLPQSPQPAKVSVLPQLGFSTKKQKDTRKQVEKLLEFMAKPAPLSQLEPGFVYCFTEKSSPGYVKLGWSQAGQSCEPHLTDEELDTDVKEHRDVERRIEDWTKGCSLQTQAEFALYMPCAAGRIERLIHRTLDKYQRTVERCRKATCGTNHKEWFEMSVDSARAMVKQWQRFSNVKPYDKIGMANQFWHEAHDQHKSMSADASGNHTTCAVQWANESLPELTKKRKDELLGLAKKREDELVGCDVNRGIHKVLEENLERLRDEEYELQQKIVEFNSELEQAHRELANVQTQKFVLGKTVDEVLVSLRALDVA